MARRAAACSGIAGRRRRACDWWAVGSADWKRWRRPPDGGTAGPRDPPDLCSADAVDRVNAEFQRLSGVALPVTISARSADRHAEARGGFLFTHQGYSGPAVLDVSHVAVRSRDDGNAATITVRWSALTENDWNEAFRPKGSETVLAAVSKELPHRLAEALISAAEV